MEMVSKVQRARVLECSCEGTIEERTERQCKKVPTRWATLPGAPNHVEQPPVVSCKLNLRSTVATNSGLSEND